MFKTPPKGKPPQSPGQRGRGHTPKPTAAPGGSPAPTPAAALPTAQTEDAASDLSQPQAKDATYIVGDLILPPEVLPAEVGARQKRLEAKELQRLTAALKASELKVASQARAKLRADAAAAADKKAIVELSARLDDLTARLVYYLY